MSSILLQSLPVLLPLAEQWAKEQELYILTNGAGLSA